MGTQLFAFSACMLRVVQECFEALPLVCIVPGTSCLLA